MNNIFLTVFIFSVMTILSDVSAQETIIRLDPALEVLIAPDAKLQLVADLGETGSVEGPVWMADENSADGGYFLFCNRGPREISSWSVNTELSTAYDLQKMLPDMEADSSSCSGTAVDPQGRVVFTSSAAHSVVRIEKDGRPTILAHMFNGYPLHRPNDLTIKANGAIYFTDNSRDESGRVPPAVYLIKDGKLSQLITGLTSPNGITLSPDGNVLYVNDIRPRKVYRYDVMADDTLANGRVFIDMNGYPEEGSNDGMKTDANGNLYDTGPGGVWIISPDGRHLGTIRTPERLTNLAFGGADGKGLFMTGHTMLFHIQLK